MTTALLTVAVILALSGTVSLIVGQYFTSGSAGSADSISANCLYISGSYWIFFDLPTSLPTIRAGVRVVGVFPLWRSVEPS